MTDSEVDARALLTRLEQRAESVDARFEGSRIGSGTPRVLAHDWLHGVRNIDALAGAAPGLVA